MQSLDGTTQYSAFNPPSANVHPFAPDSPINTKLPAHPKLAPNSGAVIAHYLSFWDNFSFMSAAFDDETQDYYHPIYFSNPADPSYTVHCTAGWGTCNNEGKRVHLPNGAQPAGGTDGHLVIVDNANDTEYDFWGTSAIDPGAHTITIAWGGNTPLDGSGFGGNASESGQALWAGIIRGEELLAGHIDHALYMQLPVGGTRNSVYPAGPRGARPTAGDLADYGSRFYLALSDDEINALNVPEYKRTIYRALAHYGAYYADTGSASINFEPEASIGYTSLGALDPLSEFAIQQGIDHNGGRYHIDLSIPGVNLYDKLRVVDPCVTARNC